MPKSYQPANGLSPTEISRVARHLDAVRSTLLFAKGVLLVEGDAEQIMIPAMLAAVFGLSPAELGFSVISMSCTFFEHVAVVFAEDRIRRPCAIVTDVDEALMDIPENVHDDTKEQAHAAEAAGLTRMLGLQHFAENNRWIDCFFGKHTFEVDFINASNAREVVRMLDGIYADGAAKTRRQNSLSI
jgi:putative ATP-dependent endonuclease of OLD family